MGKTITPEQLDTILSGMNVSVDLIWDWPKVSDYEVRKELAARLNAYFLGEVDIPGVEVWSGQGFYSHNCLGVGNIPFVSIPECTDPDCKLPKELKHTHVPAVEGTEAA